MMGASLDGDLEAQGLIVWGKFADVFLGGSKATLKSPRAAGPFLAAAKLEVRLLVALYQAAKDSVCC